MRTTNEPKTKTIKLRISEEMAAQLGEGNISEKVREYINIGLKRLTVENKRYSDDEELEMIAAYMGISAEEFLKLVVKAVEDGKLYYEKGELIVGNGSTT